MGQNQVRRGKPAPAIEPAASLPPHARPFPWTTVVRPVIGVLHAPPLPASPRFGGDLAAVVGAVLRDAEALAAGGAHALLLENFGDAPFFPRRVPAAAVAHMTALAVEVRRRVSLPLGVNVLRNDGRSALAVAHAVGGAFIRVNVLCGARITDQGIVEGIAHHLLRDRAAMEAQHIQILADVDVKHSAPLAARSIGLEVNDLIHRAGAEAVIVSGAATGEPPAPDELQAVKAHAGAAPVLLGSGVTCENVSAFASWADGFIIGTAFKVDGQISNPVDRRRVKEFIAVAGG
jgi:membrane complex biogenesis BtpA family protein